MGSRRLCAEKYVTVMSTVPGCDVTTVQQHYKGSTSRFEDLDVNSLLLLNRVLRVGTDQTEQHLDNELESMNLDAT